MQALPQSLVFSISANPITSQCCQLPVFDASVCKITCTTTQMVHMCLCTHIQCRCESTKASDWRRVALAHSNAPWRLTSLLSFRIPQMTHGLPLMPEMELQWLSQWDSCTLVIVATNSRKPTSYSLLFFCSFRRRCWYVMLIRTPCVASPPLIMPSLLSIKAWDTIIPVLYPSLSPSANKTATQLPLSSLSFAHFINPTLLALSLALHLLWLQEKSATGAAAEIFIDLFSPVLFISLSSRLPPLLLRADPRNTFSTMRRQRSPPKKNVKPFFSVCCTITLTL